MTCHEPHLYWSRHGAWCTCPCGWSTGKDLYRSTFGAHLAFGHHLTTPTYSLSDVAAEFGVDLTEEETHQ